MTKTDRFTTNIYRRIALIFGVFFGVFFGARVWLYLMYRDQFSDLTAFEISQAFVYGWRFDASTIAVTIGLPILVMLLPLALIQQVITQKILGWLLFVLLVLVMGSLVADLIYFGFVQRHVGAEITLISGDMALMFDIVFNEYRWITLSFMLVVIGGAYLWQMIFCRIPEPVVYHPLSSPRLLKIRRYLVCLGGLVLLVILGRGGLQYKPLGVADAFALGSTSSGYLVLNGAFSLQHALIGSRPQPKTFMPTAVAENIVQQYIKGANDVFHDSQFPLLRTTQPSSPATTRPNIVIFLLESWDAIHIDALRRLDNLPALEVTPNFDALSAQGVLFTRFYATGQRSMDGLAAILASIPTLPGMPYLGNGLEQSRLAYLGHVAQQHNYRTLFLQTSHRGSFHIDALASQAGFEQYYGAEDIPILHKDVKQGHDWGAWDYETLMSAHQHFKQASSPFLGFVFTSTTHNPWRIPNETWQKYPPTSDKNNYLNSLYYADWALGEFFKMARQADYYANTIFVITADHISPFDLDSHYLPNRYHIPLLIIAPDLAPSHNATLGSQLDILPTLIDLAKLDATHASIGQSLFAIKDQSRGIFSVNGRLIDWIQPNAWLSHNLIQTIDYDSTLAPETLGSNQQAQMQQKLLAIYQTTLTLLLENRIYTTHY